MWQYLKQVILCGGTTYNKVKGKTLILPSYKLHLSKIRSFKTLAITRAPVGFGWTPSLS